MPRKRTLEGYQTGARGWARSRPDTKVTEWTGHIGNRSDGRMPWKETCAVDQRVALLADWLRKEWTMTELAARYAISRKTAYKWVGRYEADGAGGLVEHSRAPQRSGRAMSEPMRETLLALRRLHPHGGPRKLVAIRREREPQQRWPAPSTMGELFRREG